MNLTSTRKTQKVAHLLIDFIGQQTESKQKRFPTVKQLALKLNVSPTTICKALKFLKVQGFITAGPRKGIWITESALVPNTFTKQNTHFSVDICLPRGQLTEKRMTEDIFKGVFPAGSTLPSLKELVHRYNVCFATMKQALAGLAQDGRIIPFKKGYKVFQTSQRHNRPLLIVITTWPGSPKVSITSEFWHTLELECLRLMMDFEIYSIDEMLETSARDRYRQFRSRHQNRFIVGYLVWIQEASPDKLNSLYKILAETNKPVSLLDDVGMMGVPASIIQNRLFKLFILFYGSLPGKIAGDYLLGLGHCRIACFADRIKNSWSLNRIAGLRQAYSKTGLAEAIKEFGANGTDAWQTLQNIQPGAQPFTDIQKLLLKARQKISPHIDPLDSSMYDLCRSLLWQDMLVDIMKPFFDKAIMDTSITAWVCVNDATALCALSYLRKKNISVPKNISIMGFDNTLLSIDAALTSYNFNISATVLAMLDHVLGGKQTRTLNHKIPIEIPGMIMERATTGKAPH